jgi:LmbE family N-acetylglucosaminyl deacetylase
VVVSPHPDDEILGAGGCAARLAATGATLTLVAVTDGENSHPGRSDHLRSTRPGESAAALAVLGVPDPEILRLGLPDGAVDREQLAARLIEIIGPGDLVLAPWEGDGHPDHDATGAASVTAAAATGARALGYLVWAWHWMTAADLPWDRAFRVDLDPGTTRRKRQAARCFASQIHGPDAILPDHVLVRLTRHFEVVLCP